MVSPDQLLIGIVAHVSRTVMAYSLNSQVRANVLNIDTDPGQVGEAGVIACVANHLRVLRRLQALVVDHPWCIVLEDDALPVSDFRLHAAAALSHAPSPLIGFYTNRAGSDHNNGMLHLARSTGTRWLVTNHMLSALAYAIHTDILSAIIDWYIQFEVEKTVEGRITDWASMVRPDLYDEPRFYYTLPSLVDHSDEDSIIDPIVSKEIRKAWWVDTVNNWDTSAIEFDPRI